MIENIISKLYTSNSSEWREWMNWLYYIYIYYVYSKWTRITLQGSCCMGHIFRRVKFWSDCTLPVQQSLNPERSHSTGAMVISGWFLGTKVHLGFFLVKPARDSWVNDQFIKISATISPDIPRYPQYVWGILLESPRVITVKHTGQLNFRWEPSPWSRTPPTIQIPHLGCTEQ